MPPTDGGGGNGATTSAAVATVTATAAVRRVALVLHGRIGIWKVKASHIDNADVVWKANAPERWREAPSSMDKIDVHKHSTLVGFAAFGHASISRHVIEPNQRAGIAVDCFLHSWHRDIGPQLDALYGAVASRHEELRRKLNAVQSQHLSMKRALELASAHATAKRAPYDLFMVVRYDVLFFRPLLFAPLGGAPLWLPHWCHRYPLTAETGMLVRAACGNWAGRGEGYLVQPATVVGIHPPLGKPSQGLGREPNFDYAYLDWWFVATPRVAMTFGGIYDDYKAYHDALVRVARFPPWSHFFWGHHINKRLRMRQTVRFVLYEGVDFRLARHWSFGSHCIHHLGGGRREGDGAALVEHKRLLAEGRNADPAAVAAATRTLLASAAPGGALATLSSMGVDASVFFRRVQKPTAGARRAATQQQPEQPANTSLSSWLVQAAGGGPAQLARQCPLDGRIRLYCPWTSPVCPPSLREAILDIEEAARLAIEATSRLPAWKLYGDPSDVDEQRKEMQARRHRATGSSGDGAPGWNRSTGL